MNSSSTGAAGVTGVAAAKGSSSATGAAAWASANVQDEVVRISNQEKRTVIFVTNNVEEAVYLADRIIVMTDSPSTVLKDVRVDLPRPRSYVDPEFLRLRKEISAMVNRKR